jgi:hypothetical protein
MNRWLPILCVVALSASAGAEDLVLRPEGLGPVAIGASLSQMERLLRQKIPYDVASSCGLVSDRITEAMGVSYLMEANKVTRINVDYVGKVDGSPVRTAAGIGLGSPEEDVMKAYAGRVRVEPNSGDPSWHYLYVDEPDRSAGLAFDTDGKKVKSMHAGVYPALSYKQSCGE